MNNLDMKLIGKLAFFSVTIALGTMGVAWAAGGTFDGSLRTGIGAGAGWLLGNVSNVGKLIPDRDALAKQTTEGETP